MNGEDAPKGSGNKDSGLERQAPTVTARVLHDDGACPNNRLPVLILRGALRLPSGAAAEAVQRLLASNGWSGSWIDGIYPYHHYHSTSHEVLVVVAGSATVQLGGERGDHYDLTAGDALIVPAGVAHKRIRATTDFTVVGAYPEGRDWDMNYLKPAERPQADQNIARVPLPDRDPLFGLSGPLREHWTGA